MTDIANIGASAIRSSEIGGRISHGQASSKLNKQYQEATLELSSRIKSSGYMNREVAENTREVLNSEQTVIINKSIQSKRIVIENRIKASARASADLQRIATEVHQRVTSAQQAGTEDRNFSDFCNSKLKEVEIILNRRDSAGLSLFGGKSTSDDAVNIADAAMPGPGALPDATYTDYFKGDASLHSATLDGTAVEYGFNGSIQGARDLIFFLKSGTVVTPDHTPGSPNTQRLKGMQDGLHNAIKGLSDTSETLGRQLQAVENIADESVNNSNVAQEKFQSIVGVEEWEAWAKQQEAANQLQLLETMLAQSTRRMKDLFQNI